MLNLALGLFLLLFFAPIVTHFGGKAWYGQAALVMVALPVVLLALVCLISAARPGSLGRGLRRARRRR